MRTNIVFGALLGGAACIFLAFGVLASVAPHSAAFQYNGTRTLSVTGVSSSRASPDQLSISFAVESQEKTASAAIRANAENTSVVIAALEQAGVKESEISTSQYSVYPVYDYVKGSDDCLKYSGPAYCPPALKQVLSGYKAVNSIVVESPRLDRVGQWIDAAGQAGASRIDSLYFSVSDQRQDQIRNELISEAIANAQAKAQAALAPLGMSVTDVQSIEIDGYPVVYSKVGFQYSSGAGPTTPIIPGSQDVSASVHVTFEIGGSSESAHASNATASASAGGSFSVALDSNPTTGYSWQVKRIDGSMARLVLDEYMPASSSALGAGGKQVLTFQALKQGTTTIELQYVRPWEPDNPVRTYSINVIVGP